MGPLRPGRFTSPLARPKFGELREHALRIKLIEPARWHEVTADHVLEPPPTSIKSSARTGTDRRTVVSSLSPDAFNVLRATQAKGSDDRVTEEFIDRLRDVLERRREIELEQHALRQHEEGDQELRPTILSCRDFVRERQGENAGEAENDGISPAGCVIATRKERCR